MDKSYLLIFRSIILGYLLAFPVKILPASGNHSSLQPVVSPSRHTHPITYQQIRTLAYSGKSEEAIVLAKKYLKKQDNSDVRILLGRMLGWNKQLVEARKQLKKVLLKNPGNSDAVEALADVEIWDGNKKTALRIVCNGLKYRPKNKILIEKKTSLLKRIQAEEDSVSSPTKEDAKFLNALSIDNTFSHVSDLDEVWRASSLSYTRYTPLGSVIATINQYYRFQENRTQYEIEMYPHLFKGAYFYLDYAHSATSYLPQNRYELEGFFSLPKSFEFSLGESVLQFQSSTVHIYTGSIAKYIGNYWIAYRPYVTDGVSHHIIIRRYFSSADSYIGLSVGYGKSPKRIENPDDISADRAESITLSGRFPLNKRFLLNWNVGYGTEHFPNQRNRRETDVGMGITWRF